ncbi:MAG: hypothetical protein AMXMBFR83_03750 [Phycisphaerae bacterium]
MYRQKILKTFGEAYHPEHGCCLVSIREIPGFRADSLGGEVWKRPQAVAENPELQEKASYGAVPENRSPKGQASS